MSKRPMCPCGFIACGRCNGRGPMLIDQTEIREMLRRIVFRLPVNQAMHEDLIQEALVHLWLREKQRPGQTDGWYFQSCRFFLQNYLRNGRSVDSAKRSQAGHSPAKSAESLEACSEELISRDSVLALVSARDILFCLRKWLTP